MDDSEQTTVEIRHPLGMRPPIRVDGRKYRAIRDALLEVIPADPLGIPARTLPEAVMGKVDPALIGPGELPQWVTAVRLDLQARELLETVGGGPPAVRRRSRG